MSDALPKSNRKNVNKNTGYKSEFSVHVLRTSPCTYGKRIRYFRLTDISVTV